MKHIPNLLTLCNLIMGCLSIVFTLSAPAYFNTVDMENFFPILGVKQLEWGAICILIAAFFDVLDGLAARVLQAYSPIGKDLDSLADVVSFGVAPSMILYQFIWLSYMQEPGALDTPIWVTLPAFGIAAFAALRLARFNVTATQQKGRFLGLPVPAAGILIAFLPLIVMYQPEWRPYFLDKTTLYIFIALLCYLMVSRISFIKWQGKGGLKGWLPQIIVALSAVLSYFILGMIGVYVVFVVYLLVSLIFKAPPEDALSNKAV